MRISENELYQQDVEAAAGSDLPWEKLQNSSILLSGATGMIGSCLVDVIQHRNRNFGMNCTVYAIGRSECKAQERFFDCWDSSLFRFVSGDINQRFALPEIGKIKYVLHLASNTHPVAYATDPIGTITANIVGTNHLLQIAVKHGAERSLFASSVEVYGENCGDVERFDESYLGYLDCNTLRAGYPESKRCGEALCQAYRKQYGMDVVIPRLSRVYGPTMLRGDTKALSQFILKGVAKKNIVLKSAGTQLYSYTYVSDAVTGLLTVLLCGADGEAYNIAGECSDAQLKDIASIIAEWAGTEVVFDIPDEVEKMGYSKATKACLDSTKLQTLGWQAKYDIKSGVYQTLKILSKDIFG